MCLNFGILSRLEILKFLKTIAITIFSCYNDYRKGDNIMKIDQFLKLKADGNLFVGKNQISVNEDSSDPYFVVEQHEFDESDGTPMYSAVDGFIDFEKAFEVANNPQKYIDEISR
jgi:hypothetical protein